jgi:protein-S-isoprenylcysteine O-methyltransferase Ste14
MAHYREVRVQHHGSGWFPVACGLLVLLNLWIAVFDGAANRPVNLNLAATLSGGCIALVGLWLRFSAITNLGSFFTEELKVLTFQPLVKTGPYSVIRHPSYTALVLILLGVCITLESWWGLLYVATVLIPIVILRVTREERMLLDGFGEAYTEYKNQTRRLVPGVF